MRDTELVAAHFTELRRLQGTLEREGKAAPARHVKRLLAALERAVGVESLGIALTVNAPLGVVQMCALCHRVPAAVSFQGARYCQPCESVARSRRAGGRP